MDDLAKEDIERAKHMSEMGNYTEAFNNFITGFRKCPRLKTLHEEEFRDLLIKMNNLLVASNNQEGVFKNMSSAIKAFSKNKHLVHDIGKYLFQFGFYREALGQFQEALKLDPGFVSAERNMNSVKNLLVDRWHFRMLNDKIRNDAYYMAISETLIPFIDKVFDIGTGTGLLALFASDFSPQAITGVEASETMYELALRNTLEYRTVPVISIINCMSTQMNLSCLGLGGNRSLVITEMFDAGLFGEHVLQTLSHAWKNLISEVGRVIPYRAEFFVIGAESAHLHSKYQLCSSVKTNLNIPGLNVHLLTFNETYDCEDVHLYKDLRYLTEPQKLIEVDFNSHYDIQEKLNRLEPYDVDLNVKADGQINIIIGWFNLYLYRDISLTTDPRSNTRANAWQQAVFFDDLPLQVKANDVFKVKFLINGGKLTSFQDNNPIIRISPDTLRFLNDTEYLKKIHDCIGMACVYLGQMIEISETTIVDLCPFPIFGFQMLKRGARSLTCQARTECDKAFLETVFRANNIEMSCVTVLEGENWNEDNFHGEKYHVIFVHIFDVSGDINLHLKDIAQKLKHKHLHQGGLFMPANVKMIGQIISSKWLDINNRVYDVNVGKFQLGKHVNKYQVSQNFCLDFSLLEYSPISDHIDLGICSSVMFPEVINVPIRKTDYASAILCWYDIELMEDLGEISTNRKMSFMDGTAYLADPSIPMVCGNIANVLRCVDSNDAFKLVIDVETA